MSLDRESVSSKRDAISLCDSDKNDTTGASTVSEKRPIKRIRGKSSTTGVYVRLAEAKRQLVKMERKALERQAKEELFETMAEARRASDLSEVETLSGGVCERTEKIKDISVEDLSKRVDNDLGMVLRVADRSAHLKDTFKKALKVAADSIKELVEKFASRTRGGEMRRLKRENDRLKTELNELREDLGELRKDAGMDGEAFFLYRAEGRGRIHPPLGNMGRDLFLLRSQKEKTAAPKKMAEIRTNILKKGTVDIRKTESPAAAHTPRLSSRGKGMRKGISPCKKKVKVNLIFFNRIPHFLLLLYCYS